MSEGRCPGCRFYGFTAEDPEEAQRTQRWGHSLETAAEAGDPTCGNSPPVILSGARARMPAMTFGGCPGRSRRISVGSAE
jgi:hypothetical protein